MNYFHTGIICISVWAAADGGAALFMSAVWFLFAAIAFFEEKHGDLKAGA